MKRQVIINVEGRSIVAEEKSSLLDTLLAEGFDIPHLCHHPAVPPYGACRLCLVEVNQKGWKPEWRKLTTSCNFPVLDGLTVYVDTPRVREHVATALLLMLAHAPAAASVRDLAARYGVGMSEVRASFDEIDANNLCIHCALCTRICDVLGHSAIGTMGRGASRDVGPPHGEPPEDCVGCGSCASVCPTDCIPVTESGGKRRIWDREFEMVRCASCGRAYITVEQMKYHVKRSGLDESYFELCDECSRARTAEKMMELVP